MPPDLPLGPMVLVLAMEDLKQSIKGGFFWIWYLWFLALVIARVL